MKKGIALLLLFAFCACARQVATPAAETWAGQSTETWPQIVLTNEAKFTKQRSLQGASAFLVADARRGIIAVTAEHLLGPAGGIEPAIPPAQLNANLIEWRLYPRTLPKDYLEVAGLLPTPSSAPAFDWLVLSLKNPPQTLPATPLHLRGTPVQVGETVHMVGVSYAEPEVRQKVYTGQVIERHYGDRFRFSISPPVNIPGFSGAPILDAKGLVVGVVSLVFEPKTQGGLMIECGGEDSAALVQAMQSASP